MRQKVSLNEAKTLRSGGKSIMYNSFVKVFSILFLN